MVCAIVDDYQEICIPYQQLRDGFLIQPAQWGRNERYSPNFEGILKIFLSMILYKGYKGLGDESDWATERGFMLTFESWLSTLFIHHLIESEPGKWNVGALANELGKSRRTIHRYLKELNKCGAPLEYDYKARGFRYTDEWKSPSPLQPLLNMTDRQLRALRRSIEKESHLRELQKDPRRFAKLQDIGGR